MNAYLLSIDPGGLSGSAASASSPLYAKVNKGRPGLYKRGHLLSSHLYGPGNTTENLAPITDAANSDMSKGLEKIIHKHVFEDNEVIHLMVTTTYGNKPGRYIKAEGFLPIRLDFDLKKMTFNSDAAKAATTAAALDAAMKQPANWADADDIPVPYVKSEPPVDVLPSTELAKYLDWESKIDGKPDTAFELYDWSKKFKLGQLIIHQGLGKGFVLEVRESTVVIRFGKKSSDPDNPGATQDMQLAMNKK